VYTKGFLDAGYDAFGLDNSSFAVSEAARRVGTLRVRQCDVDRAEIPFPGLFDVLFAWDVLEHSASPAEMVAKISAKAAPGAWLFLHTSNADSLAHRLLGSDWEAYSDYSHYGVDQVSADTVRTWLDGCGWQIVEWRCDSVWVAHVDPVLAQLRQMFVRSPELATLLAERDLGDLILVVARKGKE
jgi:hypothetical protein